MKTSNRNRLDTKLVIVFVCITVLLFPLCAPKSFAELPKTELSQQEKQRLGERIYRQGILPSGEKLKAVVKGESPAPGTTFSCVACHLRSGLGSYQEGVFTPPINGVKLYQPLQWLYKGVEQKSKFSQTTFHRPAYEDTTLAAALRNGVDPSGRTLRDTMPRYLLDDGDMSILISYLKTLSDSFSPGVSDTNLRFATIITDDVHPVERDALLVSLENYVRIKNNQSNAYKKPFNRSRRMAENMLDSKELATRSLSLSRWVLKGPPETWRGQLDEYYRKEPVFALLGGISNGEWQAIHQFSEDNRIPCLLPQTNFPVISDSNWYTVYPSRGYYQEGESAARYLAGRGNALDGKRILQIVRDSLPGRTLAAGFEETLHEGGFRDIVTVRLETGETISGAVLAQKLATEKPAAVVIWDGPESVRLLKELEEAGNRPAVAMVSSRYLGKSLLTISEKSREFTAITYPFMLAPKTAKAAMGSVTVLDGDKVSADQAKTVSEDHPDRMASLANAITQVLTMSLMEMKGNYYRDNFLDVISLAPDQPSLEFGKFIFGPERRYASDGCYIVQLTSGPKPELVKKSPWVIH